MKAEVIAFLKSDIEGTYLEVLPSRWSHVLPRLCRATQQCMTASPAEQSSMQTRWNTELSLVNELLEQEHTVIRTGAALLLRLKKEKSGAGLDFRTSEFKLLLNSLLTHVTLKESIYHAWRSQLSLPSGTMRVYSHALISSSAIVDSQRVSRVLALFEE